MANRNNKALLSEEEIRAKKITKKGQISLEIKKYQYGGLTERNLQLLTSKVIEEPQPYLVIDFKNVTEDTELLLARIVLPYLRKFGLKDFEEYVSIINLQGEICHETLEIMLHSDTKVFDEYLGYTEDNDIYGDVEKHSFEEFKITFDVNWEKALKSFNLKGTQLLVNFDLEYELELFYLSYKQHNNLYRLNQIAKSACVYCSLLLIDYLNYSSFNKKYIKYICIYIESVLDQSQYTSQLNADSNSYSYYKAIDTYIQDVIKRDTVRKLPDILNTSPLWAGYHLSCVHKESKDSGYLTDVGVDFAIIFDIYKFTKLYNRVYGGYILDASTPFISMVDLAELKKSIGVQLINYHLKGSHYAVFNNGLDNPRATPYINSPVESVILRLFNRRKKVALMTLSSIELINYYMHTLSIKEEFLKLAERSYNNINDKELNITGSFKSLLQGSLDSMIIDIRKFCL